jgi:hypothetical protein
MDNAKGKLTCHGFCILAIGSKNTRYTLLAP